MSRLVEFLLDDGSSMLVEVNDEHLSGITKASRGNVIEKAQQSFEKSISKVKPAAQFILAQLRSLHDAPDEIVVAFGLKLNAEAGAIIASSSLEANYTVTLKWSKENNKPLSDT